MITFLITACNEIRELQENLKFVNIFKEKGDEVLVLLDEDKADIEIIKAAEQKSDRVIFKKLNKDFSSFKNFGIEQAKYDYILHLDADEIINAATITVIKNSIRQNKLISGIHVPRINIVNGASESDLNSFNFSFNEKGWINWPDYQPRFINRASGIYFVNAVHETFCDHSKTVFLEPVPYLAILHIKDIKKQKEQNKFYETIN
jgi:glycosyltransferase involved in cell wall biosynthesis